MNANLDTILGENNFPIFHLTYCHTQNQNTIFSNEKIPW